VFNIAQPARVWNPRRHKSVCRKTRAPHPQIRDDLGLRIRSDIAFLCAMPRIPVASLVCLFVFAMLRAVSAERLSQYPDRSLTSYCIETSAGACSAADAASRRGAKRNREGER
jgi:hypothetical protein